MLQAALLFWVGRVLEAPTWYWWVWGIFFAVKILAVFVEVFKAGRDAE